MVKLESGIMEHKQKIKTFTDLNVWKSGHKLVIIIYNITKKYPKEEIFGLTNQSRRAVVSITSNIAEGFSRSTYKDKLNFYCIAQGSATELQNQILVARDIKYLSTEEFSRLAEQTIEVNKLLNGLIKSTKIKIQDS